MTDSSIYSIGHGNKETDKFINELKEYDIDILYDVRSKPMSKFNFQFNKPWLEDDLPKVNIKYEFLGDVLGGLPKDKTCYTNGKVDYSKVREKFFFKSGIKKLVEGNNKGLKIAIMCSESNPSECHRSKLIGQELLKFNISIKHITSKGIKQQERVISELMKGKNTMDLFGEKDFTSRKSYL